MHKFISLLVAASFFASPVFSQQLQGNVEQTNHSISKIAVPQFSEFAPLKYVNATPNSEILTAMEKAFGNVFYISIIGIPIGLPMIYHAKLREKNNIWADRKFNFENSLKYCQALETQDETESCYKTLRRVELYKNAGKTTGTLKLQSDF